MTPPSLCADKRPEPPVAGGGEWVAPWHDAAVQPVRGQVRVPEPVEFAPPPELTLAEALAAPIA